MSARAHVSQTAPAVRPASVFSTSRIVAGRRPQAEHVGRPLRGTFGGVSGMTVLV
jgi:hypothetical protein